MRFLTRREVSRLASVIAVPYETLVYVLACGGLRWGERGLAPPRAGASSSLGVSTSWNPLPRWAASFTRDRIDDTILAISRADWALPPKPRSVRPYVFLSYLTGDISSCMKDGGYFMRQIRPGRSLAPDGRRGRLETGGVPVWVPAGRGRNSPPSDVRKRVGRGGLKPPACGL